MTISVFDLFSIGIGPSSSHTVGPMRAANLFLDEIIKLNDIDNIDRVQVDLYGSLALTGKGHGTDFAVVLGLEKNLPESIEPDLARTRFDQIKKQSTINLADQKVLNFDYDQDLIFHYDEVLPHHANGMSFSIYDRNNKLLLIKKYYSVGGGFVVDEESYDGTLEPANTEDVKIGNINEQPFPFSTAKELLEHCENSKKTIAEVMFANERAFRSDQEIKSGVLKIWRIMSDCINHGLNNKGILPGGLNINRRAPEIYKKLTVINNNDKCINNDMNWLSLYAIAVNEENAAGGRVVTAPTNGAAGVIPAVLYFYVEHSKANDDKIIEFLLTAAAIGILYKERASISAAEVGCQGEVGVACSMAAAAYASVLGASVNQIENAAEIGMEHNLGLTCDPIGGLVQIPCIERNAAGAVQAINAAQLALLGDGSHYVSLDKVINTMRETGRDMMSKYKETSQGGLAVNLPEC